MRVRVDPAGCDMLARGVVDLRGLHPRVDEARAHGRDDAVLDGLLEMTARRRASVKGPAMVGEADDVRKDRETE